MYYTLCYFTGLFQAVVRQIYTLFIDNKILYSVCDEISESKTRFLLQVSDDCIPCSPEALHLNHGHTQACFGNTTPKQIQYTMTDPKTDLTWQVDSTASATWGGPHVDNTLRNRIRIQRQIWLDKSTQPHRQHEADHTSIILCEIVFGHAHGLPDSHLRCKRISRKSDRCHHSQTMFSEIVTTHEKVFLRSFRGGYKSQKEDDRSTSCKCTCVLCVVVFTFVVFIVACVITVPLVHGKWSVRGKEVSFSLRFICLFV